MEKILKEELIKQCALRVHDKAMSCVGTIGEVPVKLIRKMTETITSNFVDELKPIKEDVFDRVIKLMGNETELLIRVNESEIYFVDKQKANEFDKENA